jgi:hypothetical protein
MVLVMLAPIFRITHPILDRLGNQACHLGLQEASMRLLCPKLAMLF